MRASVSTHFFCLTPLQLVLADIMSHVNLEEARDQDVLYSISANRSHATQDGRSIGPQCDPIQKG